MRARNVKIRYLDCYWLTGNLYTPIDIVAGFGLYLQWINIDRKCINDVSMIVIVEGCPNLISLGISFNTRVPFNRSSHGIITDASIKRMVECCPGIENLDISWCNEITGTSVKKIAECLPNLNCLSISNCENFTITSIIKVILVA
jgi:hypothetical protein